MLLANSLLIYLNQERTKKLETKAGNLYITTDVGSDWCSQAKKYHLEFSYIFQTQSLLVRGCNVLPRLGVLFGLQNRHPKYHKEHIKLGVNQNNWNAYIHMEKYATMSLRP